MNLIPKTIPIFPLSDNVFKQKKIQVSVARFDLIHQLVSGNKLFKLLYFLKEAQDGQLPYLVTLGGAYSNHLLATAYACRQQNITAIGLVRGHEFEHRLSETLQQCKALNMQLFFIPRADYSLINQATAATIIKLAESQFVFVPEGGYHPKGALGAAEMFTYLKAERPTHIATAVGTATTLAGLLLAEKQNIDVIGIPVLKNMTDLNLRINYLIPQKTSPSFTIFKDFHFGGYAKKTPELISFMRTLYLEQNLPTDFVYTAKMMYAIYHQAKNNYFEPGSKIICVHTGGLQGNRSLPKGLLNF